MEVISVPKHLLSRLLYNNPVCLLTSTIPNGQSNIMTITWLTCLNNNVCFKLFILERRRLFGNQLCSNHIQRGKYCYPCKLAGTPLKLLQKIRILF